MNLVFSLKMLKFAALRDKSQLSSNSKSMKLKRLIPFALTAMSLAACNKQENIEWEYMILPIEGSKLPSVYSPSDKEALMQYSDFQALKFFGSGFNITLNSYGKDGWELVSIYTTTETVFPNFGDTGYHTGVKENTRTQTVNFVFKRKLERVDE